MLATFYLSSGQTVTLQTKGEFTVQRDGLGRFSRLNWDGDLRGPVPAVWPSADEVVMLTLD